MTGDTRDRVIAVEVEVEHLRDDIRQLREEMKAVRDALADLLSLLDQLKGGKVTLGLILSAGGFVAGALATWSDIVGFLKGMLK